MRTWERRTSHGTHCRVVWTGTAHCGWRHWWMATSSVSCVDAEGGHFQHSLYAYKLFVRISWRFLMLLYANTSVFMWKSIAFWFCTVWCLHTCCEMRHFYTLRCPAPLWIIQCKPYRNRFIIAKVIDKSLGARFLWPTVYMYSCTGLQGEPKKMLCYVLS